MAGRKHCKPLGNLGGDLAAAAGPAPHEAVISTEQFGEAALRPRQVLEADAEFRGGHHCANRGRTNIGNVVATLTHSGGMTNIGRGSPCLISISRAKSVESSICVGQSMAVVVFCIVVVLSVLAG